MKINLIFSCILVLLGCNKTEIYTTSVSGRVINAGNKQPLANCTVYMQDGIEIVDFFGDPMSSDAKAIAVTDSNGKFSIELTGEYQPFYDVGISNDSLYGYIVYANQYYEGNSGGLKGLPKNKKIENMIIEYGYFGQLKIHIQSKQALNTIDTVSLLLNVPIGNEFISYKYEVTNFNQYERVNTILACRYQKYELKSKVNGTLTTRIDSIYIIPGKTVELNIDL